MEPVSRIENTAGDRSLVVHALVDGSTGSRLAATSRFFETLRVGFPTARIHIVDNASPSTSTAEITRLAQTTQCDLRRTPTRMPDYAFISSVILDPSHDGAHAIITSPLIFWDACERWTPRALLSGRLIPAHLDGSRICRPRVSAALWWLSDVTTLRERIFRLFRGSAIGFLDPFAPCLLCDDTSGVWHRYDTGANLYAALRSEAQPFTADQLDCYEDPYGGPSGADDSVVVDARRLKGIWRAQEEQYRLRAVPLTADLVFGH